MVPACGFRNSDTGIRHRFAHTSLHKFVSEIQDIFVFFTEPRITEEVLLQEHHLLQQHSLRLELLLLQLVKRCAFPLLFQLQDRPDPFDSGEEIFVMRAEV